MGGGGLANGFIGPVAPALSSALALGEGGGRTIIDECDASVLLCGVELVLVSFGEEPAVALPASECSLGICTLSLGLFSPPIWMLFVRDGGGILGNDEIDGFRDAWGRCCGCGGIDDTPFI